MKTIHEQIMDEFEKLKIVQMDTLVLLIAPHQSHIMSRDRDLENYFIRVYWDDNSFSEFTILSDESIELAGGMYRPKGATLQ